MSAQLYPGIKAVHLVLTRPYDQIRTTDIRDDLLGVKVWFSTTSGFDPAQGQGTLYSEANSLLTTITGLDEDKTYYVKYAFISRIEPDNYTVSSQLTAKTFAAGVHVYGYLTNDPVGIATDSLGVVATTTSWQTVTSGVFKVYNDNEDVTGKSDLVLGPVYSIKDNSTQGNLVANINSSTGAYYATGMTSDNGSITFQAIYNGVTIERVWSVYKGKAGQLAPIVTLTSNLKEFIYKDINATTSQTTSAIVTATLTNLTGQPVFTTQAFTRAGIMLGAGAVQISGTQSGNSFTITDAQFGALGTTLGYVIVTATLGTVFDSLTLYRLNDGTDQITVEQSNPVHTISAAANGDTVLANYIGSANTITVKKGITTLNVDNSSPYAVNTWRVTTITGVNITCDPDPEVSTTFIKYDPMAAMTADDAYIDYTITVQTTASTTQDYIVRQSFAKSKQGVQGSTARAVSLTAPRQAFITLKNTTTPTPSTIVLTATQSNFVSPVYTWLVDGQVPGTLGTISGNTFTLNSFASGNAKTIKVTVAESTGGSYSAFDEYSVYSLKEGDDSLAAGLSNENQTISCDSLGNVKTGQLPLTSTLQVVQGAHLLNGTTTPAATFSKVVEYGMTSSINASTGVVTVTALTTEFATAQYRVTVGNVILDKVLTLNKSIEGSDAPVVNLTTTNQLFIAAKNTGTISPSSVTFTASAYNLGVSPTVVWKIDGVVQSGQTGYTLTVPSFSTGAKIIRVEVTGSGTTVFDQVTLYALKEGDDSIAAGLVNENQTITCDNTGRIIGGQLPLSSSLGCARGATILAYPDVTFSKVSESGLTATINVQTGAISITAITAADSVYAMSATFRATVGSVTIDRTLTVNKSLNGKTPVKGIDYVDGTSTQVQYSDDGTTGWTTTSSATSKYIRLNTINSTGVITVTGTAALIKGSDGNSTQVEYSDNGLTGWTTTSSATTKWLRLNTVGPTGSVITQGTPTLIKGTDGTNGNSTQVEYSDNGTTGWSTTAGLNTKYMRLNIISSTGTLISQGAPVLVKGTDGVSVTGPRNATGYLYYQTASAAAPSLSSAELSSFSFTTGTFGTKPASWTYSSIVPSTTDTTQKAWAVYYSVAETTYNGTQTITVSTPFINITFDGLVTFTNNSYQTGTQVNSAATSAANTAVSNASGNYATTTLSNVTTIDGGKITTGTIDAQRLSIGPYSSPGVPRSTGERVIINQNRIEVYDSGNTRRVLIGNLAIAANTVG
jgi:hypothetical protein